MGARGLLLAGVLAVTGTGAAVNAQSGGSPLAKDGFATSEATDGDDAKDVVAFQAWQESMAKKYGLAELIVAKQRHGSTGTVDLHFEARFTRFSDRVDQSRTAEIRG